MKVGDLVRLKDDWGGRLGQEKCWVGIIIGWEGSDPVVMWNESFQQEREYRDQLQVINENR
jgi:hypothetical protein